MVLRRRALASLLLAALAPLPAAAAAAVPLRLATGDDYPPFTGRSLPGGGLITEIVTRVLQAMGRSPQIVWLPWRRGYVEAASGDVFGTFPYIRTPERERQFLFSAPLLEVTNRVFVRRDAQLSFERVEDLSGARGCMMLGGAHPRALQALIDAGRITVEAPDSLASCFRMLQAGRVDFVSINEWVAPYAAREALGHEDMVRPIGPPIEVLTQHLIVARSLPGAQVFIAQFDAALAKLRHSGDIEAIVARHRHR